MLNLITVLWLLEGPEFKLQLDDKLRCSLPPKAKITGSPLLPKVLYSSVLFAAVLTGLSGEPVQPASPV